MITHLSIQNFKSLKNITLSLEKLNVFTGLNGSGKSSLFQALLLLRQSFNVESTSKKGLIIKDGELLNLGKGKDVFYQYASKDETIDIEIEDNKNTLFWSFKYDIDAAVLSILQSNDKDSNNCNLFNNKFQYLNTEHISPKTTHKKNDNQIEKNDIGTKGEYAVHYLAKYGLDKKITNKNLMHPKAISDSLIHQVDAWLADVSPGAKLVVEEIKGIDLVKLAVKFEDHSGYSDEFQPVNVGFGITYVLPVILSILKADFDDILILENPESHLHPRGQSQIGKLIAYATEAGIQIFLETHSDHIINGIRVAVKEGKLDKKNAKLFYFERYINEKEMQTISYEILIDKNGELSNYPKGFLDEWDEQLSKLI